MIQPGTILKVVDNSSVREIRCIRVFTGNRRSVAAQGDRILGTVYRLRHQKDSAVGSKKDTAPSNKQKGIPSSLSKGDLVSAVVVRTKKSSDRSRGIGKGSHNQTGIRISFPNENSAILIATSKSNLAKGSFGGVDPLASRSKGPLSPIISSKGYTKLLSLGSSII
jgi:ribosomal protein L14